MLKPTLILLLLLLFQKFIIVGTVRDKAGRAVAGVRVSVLDENFQPIRTIFVDSSGQFFVRGLSPGRYQFNIETTGTPYQDQSSGWIELQALRVRPGGTETFPLDFVLTIKPTKESPKRGTMVFAQEVPAPARLEYERGVKLLYNHKPATGLAALQQAIRLYPDYFDALELLGTEQVKAGRYEMGIPILKQALSVNNRAVKSLYSLGVAYLKLNRLAEAIDQLTQAANLDPTNVNTLMMLGLAYGNQQQLAEAEGAFQKALKLGGAAIAEAHFYLASIYEKQKKYETAAKELELFLQESKDVKNPAQVKELIQKLREKSHQQ